jgi:tetratricopeptide (TPR) repeat protein
MIERWNRFTDWLREDRRWLVPLIFAIAFLLRLVMLLQLRETLYWDLITLDSFHYFQRGAEIAAGVNPAPEGFFMTPLYPFFQALLRWLGLTPLHFWLRLFQAVFGALSCVLVYRLVHEGTGRRWAGVIAGGLLAVLGPAMFHDMTLLVTSLATLLATAAALQLVRFSKDGKRRNLIWGAVWLGAAALAWGTFLAVALVLAVWLVLREWKAGWKRALKRVGVFAGCVLLPIVPVTIHNYVNTGEFILSTANVGINLLIGNGEEANGLYNPPDRVAQEKDFDGTGTHYLSRLWERHVTQKEADEYWTQEALEDMAAAPLTTLGNLLRKAYYFIHGFEWPQLDSYYHFKVIVPWLGLPWPTLAVVMPLALLGLGLAWRFRRELAPVYLMTIAYTAGVCLFFITGRYRFPIVPLVCALAGIAVWRLVEFIREKRWRELGLSGGALAVLAVGVNLPLTVTEELAEPGFVHYNLGSRLMISDRPAEAAEQFALAVAELEDPPPPFYVDWGVVEHRLGNLEQAAELYETALESGGQTIPKLPMNLATALMELGRYAEAEEAYLHATRLTPHWRDAWLGAADAALARGDRLAALEHLRAVVGTLATDPVLLTRRADLLLDLDQFRQARRDYELALDTADFPPARLGLARAHAALGDFPSAVEQLELILAITPPDEQPGRDEVQRLQAAARALLRELEDTHSAE